MNNILARGKKVLMAPQETILSAASVIMVMIVASRAGGAFKCLYSGFYKTIEKG